ncbi:hypothetical protein [Nonomuraea sp. 10N515B]|uniref:hypothetical protein n=1 Tax=Nonomuraea sp. 10N515B TaxID=3457422 RepID=UPI003FCC61C7
MVHRFRFVGGERRSGTGRSGLPGVQHGPDASLGKDLVHERRKLPSPVADQGASPAAGVLQIHHRLIAARQHQPAEHPKRERIQQADKHKPRSFCAN